MLVIMMCAGHTLYIFYLTFKAKGGCAVTYHSWNIDAVAGQHNQTISFDSDLEN